MRSKRLDRKYQEFNTIRKKIEFDTRNPLTVILASGEIIRRCCDVADNKHDTLGKMCEKVTEIDKQLTKLRVENFPYPQMSLERGTDQLMTIRFYRATLEEGAEKIRDAVSYIKEHYNGVIEENCHEYMGMLGRNIEELMNIMSTSIPKKYSK